MTPVAGPGNPNRHLQCSEEEGVDPDLFLRCLSKECLSFKTCPLVFPVLNGTYERKAGRHTTRQTALHWSKNILIYLLCLSTRSFSHDALRFAFGGCPKPASEAQSSPGSASTTTHPDTSAEKRYNNDTSNERRLSPIQSMSPERMINQSILRYHCRQSHCRHASASQRGDDTRIQRATEAIPPPPTKKQRSTAHAGSSL